jgi:hypothetical protein
MLNRNLLRTIIIILCLLSFSYAQNSDHDDKSQSSCDDDCVTGIMFLVGERSLTFADGTT